MVNPAVQLASKIPDKNLQVWAVSLLAGNGGQINDFTSLKVK